MMKTTEMLAKEAGLVNFDYAVPFDWMAHGIKLTGLNMGIVVWNYDTPGIFGTPFALDNEGEIFLAAYKAAETKERCFGVNARCGHSLVDECNAVAASLDAAIEELTAKRS